MLFGALHIIVRLLYLFIVSSHRSNPEIYLNGGYADDGIGNSNDTTSVHIFVREAFSGAMLLEEHQVNT